MTVARSHMIDCQLRPNEVNDERLIAAIRSVPREHFVPKAKRSVAYVDEDIAIGEGRYLMEPMVFARLLTEADVQSSDVVLDIGGATGYSAAVIAGLAEAVVALEEDKKLAAAAEKKLGELEIINTAVVQGAHAEGVAKQGPFDVIFIGGLVEEVPQALLKQLADGGRLVCVREKDGVGRAHIVTREDGQFAARDLFDANVPPIPGFAKPAGFVF
ncbi:protein-L-isoaspartate O-methyltransferase family protein [Gimibacter soli]|uniref:Protein-L-isoaspartate O-methyltransferase n=1 Tax=Gimibacter soli TaxID=3024400 RepID=A0AAF0BIU1_9PROT|nr:protein-L-isoaspartate O-methyltransferase [Gimibacter soli]WCL55798.1 protein-L-isoaspartate O-methyltransferase [Gimibacter soli]